MEQSKLNEILRLHKLWLDDKGGERANLSNANLSYVDLSGANLRNANLRYANLSNVNLSYVDLRDANLSNANLSNANLRGANLDFSQLNLSCKGLNFKIDERIAKQIAYHLVNLMDYSKIELPSDLRQFANETHLIKEHKLDTLKGKTDEH